MRITLLCHGNTMVNNKTINTTDHLIELHCYLLSIYNSIVDLKHKKGQTTLCSLGVYVIDVNVLDKYLARKGRINKLTIVMSPTITNQCNFPVNKLLSV